MRKLREQIRYLNFELGLRFLNSLQKIICKYLQHFLAKVLYQGRQPFGLNEGTVFSGWPQQYILTILFDLICFFCPSFAISAHMGNPSFSCHVLRLRNSKYFVFQNILAVIKFRIKTDWKTRKKTGTILHTPVEAMYKICEIVVGYGKWEIRTWVKVGEE